MELSLFSSSLNLIGEPLFDLTQLMESILVDVDQKKMFLLIADNSLDFVWIYTQLMKHGHCCILLDKKSDTGEINSTIRSFCPFCIVSKDVTYNGYESYKCKDIWFHIITQEVNYSIDDELAVLLSTSGTVSSKFVALSYNNLISNSKSIVQYLGLTDKDVGVTNLPITYSYGLSVINSHWFAGARLLCTNHSVVSKMFWDKFKFYGCTSLSGVPKTYDLFDYVDFSSIDLPSLRFMTQAGGRMRLDMVKKYHQLSVEKGFRFFVMYGQTEATARISYVPPENLGERIGSVGIAVPDGEVFVSLGEVFYRGDNVMMGYVELYGDLTGIDSPFTLNTGDVGYMHDGYLYLTGRRDRNFEINGHNISLGCLEHGISNKLCIDVAVTYDGDNILIYVEREEMIDRINTYLDVEYPSLSSIMQVQHCSIPYNLHGKIDYNKVGECV